MAKTTAERMRDYRMRVKQKGGKEFKVTLSADEVHVIELLRSQAYPELEFGGVAAKMLRVVLKRSASVAIERNRLEKEFKVDPEIITEYGEYEAERCAKPFTAEEFLAIHEAVKLQN